MKTEYRYIYFKLHPIQDAKKKTKVWLCYNIKSDAVLAEIKWYPPWRQYCFVPGSYTVFNDGCLKDVVDFLNQLNNRNGQGE